MSERFSMLSAPWLAAFERETQRAIDAADEAVRNASFTLVELFRDAPEDIAWPPGRVPGFELRVEGGRARVLLGAAPDAGYDVLKESEWDDAVESARLPVGPERDERLFTQFKEGRMTLKGDLGRIPRCFAAVHDAMHELTA